MDVTYFNWRKHRYCVQITFWPTLVCAVLFCVLILLGFWQLHRYHWKQQLVEQYHSRLQQVPIPLGQAMRQGELRFQHVFVQGHYRNEDTLLLDHRMHDQRIGYEVLTPLKIKGQNKLLLVDRGWLAKQSMPDLPAITKVENLQTISGYIKLLDEKDFILGENTLQPQQRPLVMQRIDLEELSTLTKEQYLPFILRLDADQPHGFVRDWQVVNMLPQRHMAYAVQWFAMALVLLIAYGCLCCKRIEEAYQSE